MSAPTRDTAPSAPRPPNETDRLAALRHYELVDTASEAAFELIVELAASVFGVPIAMVSLMDADRQWFKACCGMAATEMQREVAFCRFTILADEVMVVPDAHLDPRFADNPLVTGEPGIRFYAGAPLHTADGFNIGTIGLIDTKPRARFGQAERRRLASLAAITMELIEERRRGLHAKEHAAQAAAEHQRLDTDITEFKKIDRMKSEFISTVSHELRTPLTSIKGSLGLLLGGLAGPLPERGRQMVEIAAGNTDRLIRLINNILDIEKIENGWMSFRREVLDLGPLLASSVEQNQAYADQFGVRLELAPVPGALRVEADGDRLLQVMANLLSNAIKFSPPGGVVAVAAEHHGDDRVRVSVRDRGGGVPQEFRSRIFQKFAQADSSDSRQRGGTGLGLSICRMIVERLGGSIEFASEAGAGTTFYFDLPLPHLQQAAPVSSAEPAPAPAADWLEKPVDRMRLLDAVGAAASSCPSGRRARVLHVDDDDNLRRVIDTALRDDGVTVDGAAGLHHAKDRLRHSRYDLVLLDLGLPDGTGLEMLHYMAATGHGSTPVVIFSANDANDEVARMVAAQLIKSRTTVDDLRAVILANLAEVRRDRADDR